MPKFDPESHERARRKFKKSSKTESGNDLPHHDLGGRRLDRSLADNLPVRCERSDYMGLAQLTERAGNTIVTGHATTMHRRN
jgi:hypothetical protein